MSLPTDPRSAPPLDPHADPLVASAVRAAANAPTADCPDTELLALYAERGLGVADLAAVETHLDRCPRCQAIVAACVRALPDDGVDPALSRPGAPVVRGAGAWFAGWRWLVPLTSVAAVAVVAVWVGRAPSDQVAREERANGFSRPAAPAPTRAPDDATASRDTRAGAVREAGTDRQDAARPRDAAGLSPTPQQSLRALRREDAHKKAVAAESVADARQLAGAPGVAEVRPTEQTAARERAEAAPVAAAPPPAAAAADAARAPAQATPGAGVSGAAAGSAGNEVRAAKTLDGILAGTVTYRAREALPAGAVVEVRLLDVSRADAPADTLARAQIVTRGEQVPVAFTVTYDPRAIEARRRYVMTATIAVEGQVLWRTTTPHPVFVAGAVPASPLTIVVDQMR